VSDSLRDKLNATDGVNWTRESFFSGRSSPQFEYTHICTKCELIRHAYSDVSLSVGLKQGKSPEKAINKE
jgi:hypothetical protein